MNQINCFNIENNPNLYLEMMQHLDVLQKRNAGYFN